GVGETSAYALGCEKTKTTSNPLTTLTAAEVRQLDNPPQEDQNKPCPVVPSPLSAPPPIAYVPPFSHLPQDAKVNESLGAPQPPLPKDPSLTQQKVQPDKVDQWDSNQSGAPARWRFGSEQTPQKAGRTKVFDNPLFGN